MAHQGVPVTGTAVSMPAGAASISSRRGQRGGANGRGRPSCVKEDGPHRDVITRPFPWRAVTMVAACGFVVIWNIGAAMYNSSIEEEKRRDPTHVIIENDRSATHIAGISAAGWISTVIAVVVGLALVVGMHSARIELDLRAKTMTVRRFFMPCACRSDVRVIDLEQLDPQLIRCSASTTRDKKVTCEVSIAHPVLGTIDLDDTDPVPANAVADTDAYAAAVRQQWVDYLALFRRREPPSQHHRAPAFPAPPAAALPRQDLPPARATAATTSDAVESAPLVPADERTTTSVDGGDVHAVVVHPMDVEEDEIDPVI